MQVLQSLQRQQHDTLAEQWRTMDPEAMCATINDNQRMQEKCDEYGEKLVGFYSLDKVTGDKYGDECEDVEGDCDLLIAIIEEVSSEYIALAVKAVSFLARCVLEDLDEPFFSKLFSPAWESETTDNMVNVMVATLSDYFKDLKDWLSDYFFCKFVKEALDIAVRHYVMAVRRKANNTFVFVSPAKAAQRVRAEKLVIHEFFSEHLELLAKGGLKLDKSAVDGALATGARSPPHPLGQAFFTPIKENSATAEADRLGDAGDVGGELSVSSLEAVSVALAQVLEPLDWLAMLVETGRLDPAPSDSELEINPAEACKAAMDLFKLWGADGLKVVQGCVYSNPALSKADRIAEVQLAKALCKCQLALIQLLFSSEPLSNDCMSFFQVLPVFSKNSLLMFAFHFMSTTSPMNWKLVLTF